MSLITSMSSITAPKENTMEKIANFIFAPTFGDVSYQIALDNHRCNENAIKDLQTRIESLQQHISTSTSPSGDLNSNPEKNCHDLEHLAYLQTRLAAELDYQARLEKWKNRSWLYKQFVSPPDWA
jgi:hypothetical protein